MSCDRQGLVVIWNTDTCKNEHRKVCDCGGFTYMLQVDNKVIHMSTIRLSNSPYYARNYAHSHCLIKYIHSIISGDFSGRAKSRYRQFQDQMNAVSGQKCSISFRRRFGLIVSASDSGSSGPGSNPGQFSRARTPELQNSKTPKLQNSRTPELQNSRAQELKNSRTQCSWARTWAFYSLVPPPPSPERSHCLSPSGCINWKQ